MTVITERLARLRREMAQRGMDGYVGVIGVSVDVVNILIFQAAVLLAFWVSTALQRRGALTGPVWQAAGVLVMAAVCAAFAVWTVSPPELPVFTDPTDGTRGITT